MFEVLKDSFKVAFKKPLTYIALVAVPVIVALFGLLYPATFIDPYEKMKDIPVAIINKDEGIFANDEWHCFGDDIVDAVLDNDSVRWVKEDANVLDEGINNTDYYIAVVIPEDFSEHVLAGQTANPEQANLIFVKNVRRNYMFSTMSTKVETALQETLNGKIAAQYAEALAEGLVEAEDGFLEASEGSEKLAEGLTNAADGSSELTQGLSDLKDGTGTISEGLDKLNGSSLTLLNGSAGVKEGINQLQDGSKLYLDSLTATQEKIASSFGGNSADGIAAAKAQYAQALKNYTITVAQVTAAGGDPASVDSSSVTNAVESLAQMTQAAGSYGALEQACEGYAKIEQGINNFGTSYEALDSGISAYTQAVSVLASGEKSAVSGTEKLYQGSEALGSGLSSAVEGSRDIQNGLQQGAQTIDESLTTSPDELSDYMVSPSSIEEENYGDLDKFGYGFAPLFMTMCLWLGSLIIFFVFDPFPSRNLRENTGRFAAIFGRWPIYLVFSVLEAAAVCVGACLVGISFQDFGTAVLLYACIAFSFMCMMQLFNLFDIPGKAFAILLLIVQLVACSGTLPAELGNAAVEAMGPWFPFYYGIDAFREIMSGTHGGVVYADMGMILLFAVGAIVVSLLVYPLALKLKEKRDAQLLKELV